MARKIRYQVPINTFNEIIEGKYIGIVSTFMDLLNSNNTTKDLEKDMEFNIDKIKEHVQSSKKNICSDEGMYTNVSKNTPSLALILSIARIDMNTGDCNVDHPEFQTIADSFKNSLRTALKAYNVNLVGYELTQVEEDEYFSILHLTDNIRIEITVHIPTTNPVYNVKTTEYASNIWIEMVLSVISDEVVDG